MGAIYNIIYIHTKPQIEYNYLVTTFSFRDAPILISVSVSANIGHIFNIGTSVKSITLTNITLAFDIGTGIDNIGTDIGNIGILVKVSLANQFHKCMYLLF